MGSYNYKEIIYSQEPDIYYTRKHIDMALANKSRIQQRQLSDQQRQLDQKERRTKHQNFAKFMKSPLASIPNSSRACEAEAKNKVQRHKKHWKALDSDYEDQLNHIYSKVIKRPFLYEQQGGKQPS